MKFKKVIPVVCLITGVAFFSCRNDKIENAPCNGAIPTTVSFTSNILPLFKTYCSTAGCHSDGSPAGHLNLEDSVAYSELMHTGSGYIDTVNPNFSILYTKMTSTTLFMPPTGKLNECRINLVLKWIQQGAHNN